MRDMLMNLRVLCVIDFCEHCASYKRFIEELNMKLPLTKQIKVVNFSRYYDLGIVDPIVRALNKYVEGSFPTLFYEGMKLQGSVESEVLEQFMKTLLGDDFKIKEPNEFIYQPDCEYVKKGFLRKKIICH